MFILNLVILFSYLILSIGTNEIILPLSVDTKNDLLRTEIILDTEQIFKPIVDFFTTDLYVYNGMGEYFKDQKVKFYSNHSNSYNNSCKDKNQGSRIYKGFQSICITNNITLKASNIQNNSINQELELYLFMHSISATWLPSEGLFGISPVLIESEHSFVKYLYNENIISNQIIALHLDNDTHGQISIGIDEDKYNNTVYLEKFSYKEDKIKITVDIGNKTKNQISTATLSFEYDYIYVATADCFDIFEAYFKFNKTNDLSSICGITGTASANYIRCDERIRNITLPKVNLNFGNFNLTLDRMEDLFLKGTSDADLPYTFMIAGLRTLNYDSIYIGYNILRVADLVIDQANSRIGMNGNNIKSNIKPFTLQIWHIVLLVLTGIILIGAGYMLYFIIKRKQRRSLMERLM